MSGVRVQNQELMALGLTLPGFVERSQVIASLPSLGLLTLAAHTPPHWNVTYTELDQYQESDITAILDQQPDIVAFSALTARINETYALAQRFRQAGITVVIGGLHVTALPQEAQPYVDVVIQGEGERIWEQLLNDFEQQQVQPLYSSLTTPKYNFPLHQARIPRYDLLDLSNYNRLTLQTTRGCPLHCSFCAASRTLSAYKKKPLEHIQRELDAIFALWDRPFIELADDNTFVDKKWSKELLKLFGQYKMKWFTETDISVAYDEELLELLAASNCAQVLIGFETSEAEGLKGIDRNDWKYRQFEQYLTAIEKIQSYGISVNGCFIIGFDTDTPESLKRTEEFILSSGLSEVQLTLLTPFPGTDLYTRLKQQNRLLADEYWDKCTLFDLTFVPKHFTVEELEAEFQGLMSRVYAPEVVSQRKRHFRQLLRNKIA